MTLTLTTTGSCEDRTEMSHPCKLDFILDENGILRAAPVSHGNDSGIESVTPTAKLTPVPKSTHAYADLDDDDDETSYRLPPLQGFDADLGQDWSQSSSGSTIEAQGPESYSDRSQDDWFESQGPLGILKNRGREHQHQGFDYPGPVPNNTQEFDPVPHYNSQTSDNDFESNPLSDAGRSLSKTSNDTVEERDDLNTTLVFEDGGNGSVNEEQGDYNDNHNGGDRYNGDPYTSDRYTGDSAASNNSSLSKHRNDDPVLTDIDIQPLDLTELERYAESEINNRNHERAEYSSIDSSKYPSTLPSIYLRSGRKDLYSSRDDVSGSSLHLAETEMSRDTDIDDDLHIFQGAAIQFGESCDEGGADMLIQQHIKDAQAYDQVDINEDNLLMQDDIPHSLIEFEAMEVQMQIQQQLAQLKEEDDVVSDYLQNAEAPKPSATDLTTDHESSFQKGDSLPFDTTQDSDDLRTKQTPNSGPPTPSKIPRKLSFTKRDSMRSSTDSLSSNAAVTKIPKKPPSPSRSPQKPPSPSRSPQKPPSPSRSPQKSKENRRPSDPVKFRRNSGRSNTPSKLPAAAIVRKPGPKPVKATAVPNLDLGAGDDDEKAKEKLKGKLETETNQRVQQQEVIRHLQEDYDRLLTKFALAEVTIDQLRLGAKMNLYSDSPTPQSMGQVQQVTPAQQIQQLNVGTRGQGHLSNMNGRRAMGDFLTLDNLNNQPASRSSVSALTPLSFGDYDEPARFRDDNSGSDRGESKKISLLFQARSLSDQMESFQMLLDEDELNTEEQEKVIDKVKVDFDKLQSEYRQAKDEQLLQKQNTLYDADQLTEFDSEKVVEGELFRLGMKLDDLQQNVEENMSIAKRRTPFQDLARPQQNGKSTKEVSNGFLTATNVRHHDDSSTGTTDLDVDPLDAKWQKLQKDYSTLLDLFDRMKQLPKTAERDNDIAALMKKLQNLHRQSPGKLGPLPSLPDSDDETLDGSIFGSTSSVVRATPKSQPGLQSESGSSRRDRYQKSRDGSSKDRGATRERDREGRDGRQRVRSQSSYQGSDRGKPEVPRAPRPSADLIKGPEMVPPPRKDFSDHDSSRDRRGRTKSDANSMADSHDGLSTTMDRPSNNPKSQKVHQRRGPDLDRDSGFIGSESSRQSQSNVSKRPGNMSTLTDEDTSLQFPYKPSNSLPAHTAPPQHTWTDSELSSAIGQPIRTQHRNPKRSMTSVASDPSRQRKSGRGTEGGYRKERRGRDESEGEALSTGRASIKSEKIKNLEGELEKLNDLVRQQHQERELEKKQQAVAPSNQVADVKPWQHSYPWIDDRRGSSRYQDGLSKPRESYPQTWADYPYHSTRRRPSLDDSDIPSIDTLEPSQSALRRHSLSSAGRLQLEKRLDSSPARDSPIREPDQVRAPRPRDLDRQRERQEAELQSRRSTNHKLRSRSMPRKFNYDTDDSPSRDESRMRDTSPEYERECIPSRRRNSHKTNARLNPKYRYSSHNDLQMAQESAEETRPHRSEYSPRNRVDSFDSIAVEQLVDHEKHYRFFRDLEKGREHIQKVLSNAAEKQKKSKEEEKKRKKREPVIVTGHGTFTKTQTQCCPMCKGKGECTHTEVYHLPPPLAPQPLGMGYVGTSQIPVNNRDIGQSVQNSLNAPQLLSPPQPGAPAPPGMYQQCPPSMPGQYAPSMPGQYAPSMPVTPGVPNLARPGPAPVTPTAYPQSVPMVQAAYPQSVPMVQAAYPQSVPMVQAAYPQSVPMVQAAYPQSVPMVQAAYPQSAVTATPAQQFTTSTPYETRRPSSRGGEGEERDGPVIKIPLRLYEHKRNVKYMVREYSSDDRNSPDKDNQTSQKNPHRNVLPSRPSVQFSHQEDPGQVILRDVTLTYRPSVSSSVPPRDSRRRRSSTRQSDDDDDGESYLSDVQNRQPIRCHDKNYMNESLDHAVRLATQLRKLSGKMRHEVKNDLRKSVRNEDVWATNS